MTLISLGACVAQEIKVKSELNLEPNFETPVLFEPHVDAENVINDVDKPLTSSVTAPREPDTYEPDINEYERKYPRLKAGDQLNVFIYGEPELSRFYTLDSSGHIALSLVGNLALSGLTLLEAKEAIIEIYKDGYLLHPDITIELVKERR